MTRHRLLIAGCIDPAGIENGKVHVLTLPCTSEQLETKMLACVEVDVEDYSSGRFDDQIPDRTTADAKVHCGADIHVLAAGSFDGSGSAGAMEKAFATSFSSGGRGAPDLTIAKVEMADETFSLETLTRLVNALPHMRDDDRARALRLWNTRHKSGPELAALLGLFGPA